MKNLFDAKDAQASLPEVTESILHGESFRLERIISCGHATAPGAWYDQEWDEWVAVLQGEGTIAYADGRCVDIRRGEWEFIASHTRHRVVRTSSDPPCIWLALHVGPPGS